MSAVADLFSDNVPLVATAANRLRINDSSRDDCIQEGLVALWRCAHRWDETRGGSFRPYAWRRIVGAMQDHRRAWARGRLRLVTRAQLVPLDDYDVAVDADPLTALEAKRLRAAALTVPHGADLLAVVDGATQRELAERDGITESAVSLRLRKARDQILRKAS